MNEEMKHEKHNEYLEFVQAEQNKRSKLYSHLQKDDPLTHIKFNPIISFEEWLTQNTKT